MNRCSINAAGCQRNGWWLPNTHNSSIQFFFLGPDYLNRTMDKAFSHLINVPKVPLQRRTKDGRASYNKKAYNNWMATKKTRYQGKYNTTKDVSHMVYKHSTTQSERIPIMQHLTEWRMHCYQKRQNSPGIDFSLRIPSIYSCNIH